MSIYFIHIPKNAGNSVKHLIDERKLRYFKYLYHDTDVSSIGKKKTVIILRDPLDRFASAVRYALQKWSCTPHIKKLISLGLTDPNQWAEILANPSHKDRNYVLGELINCNSHHTIGNTKLYMKWPYTPQHFWYNNPTYVLFYETLDQDFNRLMNELGYRSIKLHNDNATTKINFNYSDKARKYLMDIYKRDYEIIHREKSKCR